MQISRTDPHNGYPIRVLNLGAIVHACVAAVVIVRDGRLTTLRMVTTPGIPRSHRFACSRPIRLAKGAVERILECSGALHLYGSGLGAMVGESEEQRWFRQCERRTRTGFCSESLDLEDGQEVGLSISETGDAPDAIKARVETAGSWKGLVDAERLKRDIYESRR